MGALAGATLMLSVLWLPWSDGVVERATGGRLYEGPLWELMLTLFISAAVAGAMLWAWRADRLATSTPGRLRAAVADWYGLATLSRVAVVDPTLALSRALARADDRIVDAGVRGAQRVARTVSRLAWTRGEWSLDAFVRGVAGAVGLGARGTRGTDERAVDGVVRAIAALTLKGAVVSRAADDRGVDGAVEGSAWIVGAGGRASRKLQTGQAHHYYAIVAVGFAVAAAIALLLSS